VPPTTTEAISLRFLQQAQGKQEWRRKVAATRAKQILIGSSVGIRGEDDVPEEGSG
jgi:hypothetical protein